MKVLLYFEGESILAKSGIGRALEHQKRALTEMGIDYTTDPLATDYDILHINTYGINSRSMIKKARKLGKKVIYHAHTTEEDFRDSFIGSNQLSPLVKKYLVSLYSRADCLITPTPYSKSLLENYGIELPIKAISNGIDLDKYQRNPDKEALFRQHFQIKEAEKVIICVGLYFERKGITDFIKIAEALPEYRFIWFGHTPLISIPNHVRKLVLDKHPENVEFPGYIKGDVIEGAFSASDLFFFPSYEETEGIVVLEALASQQNVLVRDIPVYDKWLEDGVNCYKGQNNHEFITKIQQIINQELPSTKEKALAVAEERSITEVGKLLKAVYEEVLSQKELEKTESEYSYQQN
ncbi:glycosyltransferase [Vagococcus salmoninarum]|uniref:glycosyltransferase n=1 Tax=Vagococcus salmoninarum TaxID=2739 RepID=UPI0028D29943|nr:glycosyltransferase [Vagococcus salmoninarum]